MPEDIERDYERIFQAKPPVKEQLGMLGVLLFAEALEKLKHYEPAAVGQAVRTLSQTYFADKGRDIKMVIHQVEKSGGAYVRGDR